MSRSDPAHAGLALVLELFQQEAATVRQLALRDRAFRGLCEDYALARASLAGFEAREDAAERPEIGDYRTVIAELEGEITQFVRAANRGKTAMGEKR